MVADPPACSGGGEGGDDEDNAVSVCRPAATLPAAPTVGICAAAAATAALTAASASTLRWLKGGRGGETAVEAAAVETGTAAWGSVFRAVTLGGDPAAAWAPLATTRWYCWFKVVVIFQRRHCY